MRDLISRKALMKYIMENGLLGDGWSNDEREYNLINMINDQPTAFDTDKVVEKLEIISNNIPGVEENRFAYDLIRKSIEIVKDGGIDA